MVKFCSNCGHEIEDDAIFCMECGAKVDASSEKKDFKSTLNKENIKESMNKINESVEKASSNFNESVEKASNNFNDSVEKASNNFNDSFSDVFDSYNINMMDGERIIRHSQIHPGCLYAPLILTALGFIFMILTLFAGFIFFIIPLLWLIVRFIAYTSNDLILTNKRVFGKTGLISTTQMQSPLNMINSVAFNNGMIGKFLGYGTVQVVTASTMYKFRFIREGQTLYSDIFQQLERTEKEKLQEQAEAIADAISKKQ